MAKATIEEFCGAYYFLSNFYVAPFTDVKGRMWPTVEHYYQAHKTPIKEEFKAIRLAETPGIAKQLGSKCSLRDDWNSARITVMRKALRYKFWQNTPLRVQLMSTHPRDLVEGNTWGDRFWGVCKGTGENMLGFLLCELRNGYVRMFNEGFDMMYPYYEAQRELEARDVRKAETNNVPRLFDFDPQQLKALNRRH